MYLVLPRQIHNYPESLKQTFLLCDRLSSSASTLRIYNSMQAAVSSWFYMLVTQASHETKGVWRNQVEKKILLSLICVFILHALRLGDTEDD